MQKQWWYVGARESCVRDSVVLAGVTFPKRTRRRVEGEPDGTPNAWTTERGQYIRATQAQMEATAKAIALRVQRRRAPDDPRGLILRRDHEQYDPRPTDEPLQDHLWLDPVEAPPAVKAQKRQETELDRMIARFRKMGAEQRDTVKEGLETAKKTVSARKKAAALKG